MEGKGTDRPGFSLEGDLLREVMKHMDAQSLSRSACVSRQWRKAAQDEKLWESLCLRHLHLSRRDFSTTQQQQNQQKQLRSVLSAMGGFRSFYCHSLRPLLHPHNNNNTSSSSSRWWGKDGVQLSLSLFSIHCYESIHVPNNLQSFSVQASQHPAFPNNPAPPAPPADHQ